MAGIFDTVSNFASAVKEVTPDGATIVKEGRRIVKDSVSITKEFTEMVANDVTKEKESVELDKEIEKAIDKYNAVYEQMDETGRNLYIERLLSVEAISNIEILVNSISNHPKEFDKEISEIVTDKQRFTSSVEYASRELEEAKKAAEVSGAGVAASVGFVSLAPSAAMWVATTFGTASTGAAISTLSGAAASNAALAWLGGGALAAGGSGISGGTALLALAGPIGWGIAGASILASIALFTKKKSELNEEKVNEIEKIKTNTLSIKEIDAKMQNCSDRTKLLKEQVKNLYAECLYAFGKDYNEISDGMKMKLGAIVNNTKSLAALLGNIE